MYRRGLSGSHVILNLPHFQPIRSSDFAAQSISQSENVAEAEKCATCFYPVDISPLVVGENVREYLGDKTRYTT